MKIEKYILPDKTETIIKWFGEENPEKGTILFLPALGATIDYYQLMAKKWSKHGFQLALLESRGMKHSSVKNVKTENFGYDEILHTDLATIIPSITESSKKPVWICGHSLGGQLALLHLCEKPHKIAGVILIAAGSNYFRALPAVLNKISRLSGIIFIRLINSLIGYFPGHKFGFGGLQPKNMIRDWSYEALHGKYKIYNNTKNFNTLLQSLQIEVLMISLSGDKLVPRSSANFLAGKLLKANVVQIELQPDDFGLKEVGHFQWIQKPDPVIRTVNDWIDKLYKL